METSAFDFDLPDDRIAPHPIEPRDRSRLMVVRRSTGSIEHRIFADLPELLRAGDVIVRNNTRVVPARIIGRRDRTGGAWEGLFLRESPDGPGWEILAKSGGRPADGEKVTLDRGLTLTLVRRIDGGRWLVRPAVDGPAAEILADHGHVPLPPYIRKGRDEPADRLRYQTTFARVPGAVAAPTAGLHFTDDLFGRLAERGVGVVDVTLHVGLGTFRPIQAERIEDHQMQAEWAELTPDVSATIRAARADGGRVIAVGTTSARTLEAASIDAPCSPFCGETTLYLQPGHQFRGLDALVTNFHLPRSSLLVLVSALAGVDLIRRAYSEAIASGYRFYSYGDAMVIL